MTDNTTDNKPKTGVLSLGGRARLEAKKTADGGGSSTTRQSFSHGRSKTVIVETKRPGARRPEGDAPAQPQRPADPSVAASLKPRTGGAPRVLTNEEREARLRALSRAGTEERRPSADPVMFEPVDQPESAVAENIEAAPTPVEPPKPSLPMDPESLRRREMEEMKRIEADEAARILAERRRLDSQAKARQPAQTSERNRPAGTTSAANAARLAPGARPAGAPDRPPPSDAPAGAGTEDDRRGGRRATPPKVPERPSRGAGDDRRQRKVSIQDVSSEDGPQARVRSMAAFKRAQAKNMRRGAAEEAVKVTRDVIIPEFITVQELANRMTERAGDVIKQLMKMGVMATITQSIDGDTAELIATEFGHRAQRVAESDVETGITGDEDVAENLIPRAPVVTVMGHVDHGKTSLLDAIRKTDVVAGEAGGITQHIGAYQVTMPAGQKVTFIDTPGHAAFSEMRARGANVTDIVVLVVAANDGVMPQTIEAIAHAKAAKVPVVVAINKIDLPDAKPDRVRNELLSHELVVESLGGDVLDVEVSAKGRKNLDKLVEAIMLQAEVLDLRANPDRKGVGRVIEAKLEKGRGAVATVLVQRGTLKVGDIFVAGSEWGRVRAMNNDHGKPITSAGPGVPVEVLGFGATPLAGDEFVVLDSESKAREIAEFRARKRREAQSAAQARGSVEQMFSKISAGELKELAVIVKGDVQGSVEAIAGSLAKVAGDNKEVGVRVLFSGVGAINESDITLAKASNALIIGFNVRANPQAREIARRDGVDLRYYSIIYNIIDDVKAMLSGLLAPTLREKFLGNAEIREVFNITRVGKIAGCMVTEGIVKRGAKVRLLRDSVVIHEGTLKTLRRFKDDVKEVREGFDCGMAFENYDDIKVGDVIEAFEVESVTRAL